MKHLAIRNPRTTDTGSADHRPASAADRGWRSWCGRLHGRGQTVVEFALILPVALMLTVGIVDAARLFAAYISVTNGVREAALYAGSGAYPNWCGVAVGDLPCPGGTTAANQSTDPASIGYHIQGESSGLDVSKVVLEVPACDVPVTLPPLGLGSYPCSAASNTVKITASYPFQPVTPVISALMASTLTGHAGLPVAIWITATTTAQIQK